MARVYAPALTKSEFLKVKPGGHYDNYLGYLAANRPKWDATKPYTRQTIKPPPVKAPPLTYQGLLARVGGTFETPAQLEARANRMAATQTQYQQDLIKSDYKTAQEEAMRRMLAFQAAGRSAAAMNASLIGQVGGEYQAGADQLSQLASSGAAQMAGATQGSVDAANAAAANVGMPGVTVGGPVGGPGLAGATQAGVESYRGGTLPAQALTNAGGFAEAGMAGQIGAQNLRATQEAQAAYLDAVRTANSDRTTAITKLAAGRPTAAADFLLKLQDAQRQQVALASSLIGAGYQQKMTGKKFTQDVKQTAQGNKQWWAAYNSKNDQWQTTFNENQRQFDKTIAAKATAAGVEASTVDASASRVWGYLVDKSGRPILDRNGKPIPIHEKASKGKTASMTPGQLSSLMIKAQDQAQTFFSGFGVDKSGKRVPATELGSYDEQTGTYVDEKTGKRVPTTGFLKWNQAISRLTQMGVPATSARQILSQYYERGDKAMGRPIFLPEEWAMLKQRIGKSRLQWLVNSINGMFQRGQVDEAEAMISQALGSEGSSALWVGKAG